MSLVAASGRVRSMGLLGLSGVLLVVAPGPTSLVTSVTDGTGDPTAPLLAVIGLLAWTCATLLLASTALSAAATWLPGLPGRLAGAAARWAPRPLRRVGELALGITVTTAVLTGSAWAEDAARPVSTTAVQVAAAAAQAPGLDWPAPQVAAALDLDWPNTAAPPPPTTSRSTSAARSAQRRTLAPHRAISPDPGPAVVVRPGDSLWSVARAGLGPAASNRQVAAAWPAWWSTNRAAIGDDPDLLQPGTHLVPPTTAPANTPRSQP